MSTFDKAVDKIEQSVGETREKIGLAPGNAPEVGSETDPNKASVTQPDDKIKES